MSEEKRRHSQTSYIAGNANITMTVTDVSSAQRQRERMGSVTGQNGRKVKRMRLIDADEAIERFTQIRPVNPKQSDYTHGIDVGLALAKVAIRDQKTIEPQRTGKWINLDATEAWYYMCSECHHRTDDKWNFCPNCGAKMEVEHDT
jgi:hypothetical protein